MNGEYDEAMPEAPTPLDCLTPEKINNRFLASTNLLGDLFFKEMIKESPWMKLFRENRIREIMIKNKCTRAKAMKIIKAEDKAWEKEYNSPLKVAERKIQQLEDELARIKRVVNGEEDPDDY